MKAMTTRHAPVIIIGSGPAGYTAAIYAARAMLKPLLIAGLQQGGQLTITTEVENYPGFADPIQGPWLMEQMLKQAQNVGTEIVNDMVTEVDLDTRPFRLKTDSGDEYTCDALIIATGAQAKWLGIPSEQKFQGCGRVGLRHLRRLFLSRQGRGRGRRRQLGRRGGALSVPYRPPRDRGPPARRVPRRAHPAGAAVRAGQRHGLWDTWWKRSPARRQAAVPATVTGIRLKNVKTGRGVRHAESTACSSPSATRRRSNCSPAS